ncbi:transposase [Ferroplasma sp.]|uniref:transposase n=1 Tax=Ferroplasma sp. TaxID=2591003 RepID=UPI00307F4A17
MSGEPGIKNGHYRRNLKTKNGELKLNVPEDRDEIYHSALINNDSIKVDELILLLILTGIIFKLIFSDMHVLVTLFKFLKG